MEKYVKYPRTFHLPYSECLSDDDKRLDSDEHFKNMDKIYVSIKMDGENCLRRDVKISTNKGDFTIEDIVEKKLDVLVLSLNKNGEIEYQPILNYIKNIETNDWYDIEMENGKHLYLTENHMVFVSNENIYKKVKDLTEKDYIIYNGE